MESIIEQSNKTDRRDKFIDFLKAFLIVCVIWGHSTQLLRNDRMNGLDNYFNVFIYTFQMPFFILVSGYLFYVSTQKQTPLTIIKNKLTGVLIPILVWNSVFYILMSAVSLWQGWDTIGGVLNGYIPYLFGGLWYLWAYLITSILICFVNIVFKNEIGRFCCYSLIILITHLGVGSFCHLDFMVPFFLIGYYLCKYKNRISAVLQKYSLLAMGIFFPVFYLLYKPEYSMYNLNSMFDVTRVSYYLYAYAIRFFAGVTGCAFIYLILRVVWKCISGRKISILISTIGTKTMELYILHSFLIFYLMRLILEFLNVQPFFFQRIHLTNFIFAPVVMVGTIIICLLITAVIRRIPGVRNVAFGFKMKQKSRI